MSIHKIFQFSIENRKNLDKRYKFENINEIFLKKKRSNSNRFIEYCELKTNDHFNDFVKSNDDFQKHIKISMKKKLNV